MRRLLLPTLLAGVLLAGLAPATVAQEVLTVTTRYPAVTVDPGGTARFPLLVSTDVPARVDLAVASAPDGWNVRLRGGGSTVSAVYTAPDEPPEVNLEVEVPEAAAAGSYQVTLEARAGALLTRLTVDLTVEQRESGAVTLTSQYPALSGPSDVTYQFDLELRNDTNQETTFSLETQAPRGWRVEARPTGEERASTAVVDAGGTARIRVSVTPPVGAVAGVYDILVRAAGGPEAVEVQLAVEITGTPSVSLTTADQRLNARVNAGGSTVVRLVVFNDGTAPLTNLELSATPPRNWQMTFEPPTITNLPPGESATIEATLTAAGNAIAGDYSVAVTVRSEDVRQEIQLRTTVETSPLGGLLGLGLLGIVVVGLFLVFRRYGRR